jgi:hypothetical protein
MPQTKFEIGDVVEIIPHPSEAAETIAMNPWVIKRIEIFKDEGICYSMDSLVNKTATAFNYHESWIRKTDKDAAN